MWCCHSVILNLFWVKNRGFCFLFSRCGFCYMEVDHVPAGIYNVIPTTFLPKQEGPFFLDFFSTSSLKVSQLQWRWRRGVRVPQDVSELYFGYDKASIKRQEPQIELAASPSLAGTFTEELYVDELRTGTQASLTRHICNEDILISTEETSQRVFPGCFYQNNKATK